MEVGKASLDSYAEYEQLTGGVETLFKSSANTVQQYAKNAYKTAGLSANDYMSTVTSFSASLLQSLGQDTAAAAEYADMAITDMSDNANKMGTSMESIQNAYQGFAKQNYTMLDNLKLGYGGTKTEMERLLADAEEIKRANGEMVSYSIDSFADMVEAIHVVQENMDITGTTAKEAEGTIEGSVNSMKAAWTNLSTGMADETADMEELTKVFVDSVGTAANNIVPRCQQIVRGFAEAAQDIGSYLKTTNKTIGTVVTVLEDVVVAAVAAGAAIAAVKVGKGIMTVVTGFQKAQVQLALYALNAEGASLAQGVLNGELAVGEIVVGVLTGKISLATAAQYAWNAAMNANPIGIVITLVAALAVAVKSARDAVNDLADDYVYQGESAAECAEHLEELQARYDELTNGENNPNKWAAQDREEITALAIAIEETTGRLEELTQAEADAAEQAAVMAEKTANVEGAVSQINDAAEEYVVAAQNIINSFFDVYDSVYNSLYNASTAFTEVATATTMSYDQIMASLQGNIEFNERYSDSLAFVTAAAETTGVNIDSLTAYLSGMSATDAAGALEAIRAEIEGAGGDSEAVAKILEDLNGTISEYGASAQTAGYQMAEAVVDVEAQMQEAFDAYAEAIAGLDNYQELYNAAKGSMNGLLWGIQESTPKIIGEVDDLASTMKSRLQTNFDNFTLRIEAVVETVEASLDGSHASGLDYVPFDGYIAELHKGETVLTAEQAAAYRAGVSSGGNGGGVAGETLAEIVDALNVLVASSRETAAAMAADRTFQVGEREFGRLVKQYA